MQRLFFLILRGCCNLYVVNLFITLQAITRLETVVIIRYAEVYCHVLGYPAVYSLWASQIPVQSIMMCPQAPVCIQLI